MTQRMNTCLLVRNTKGVTLSESGKTLYSYAEQMLELENKIKEQFDVTGRRSSSVLRIAASTVPRTLSAGCGLAWCAPLTERERLTGIMAEKGIEQEEIHECMV